MSQADQLSELLERGIAAAQEGNRELARRLLKQVVDQDERNARAWFWLSGVVDDPNNREVCLQHVLELEPDNVAAYEALQALRRQRLEQILQTAVAAAQKGQRDHARNLFRQVVEQDERQVEAWIWLAELAPDLDEREICLENALVLDPQNEAVRQDLERVRRLRVEIAEARAAARPRLVGVSPEPEVPVPAAAHSVSDPFADPYGCPYCGVATAPEDRKCRACGGKLWLRYPKRQERSSWFWVAFSLQVALAAWNTIGVVFLLMYVAYRVGADQAYRLVPAYLGLPSAVPRPLLTEAFAVLPRPVFLASLASLLLSLVVLVGLYLRGRPFFFLFLGNGVLSTVLTVGVTLQLRGQAILCGLGGIAMAVALIWLAFQIQDDFFSEEKRILLRPEPEAVEGHDFWLHGRRFAKAGMWALAAVHLRKALAWLPDNADLHLDLALAFLQLGRYGDAEAALAGARRLDPRGRRVQEVSALLERVRAHASQGS
jgi:tetratricopeptide (TPR) repeat protein